MPSISRIRFTNVVYDGGKKRYIDTTFRFDGFNGILLLENGAGKTVFVQTLIQTVLPRKTVAQRKIQETLQLSNSIAHIAVEWILEDQPRVYALTAISLFLSSKDTLASQEFAMEYGPSSSVRIDTLPFVKEEGGKKRPATKEEMAAYCRSVADRNMTARFFSENDSLMAYGKYIESHFRIIPAEWNKLAAINETEGGVEAFFENCRTNDTLVDRLLIPTVEEGIADENGTEKGQGNGFAELFESQRDHFRKQRELQKRIKEMQGVVEQMEGYTTVQHRTYTLEQSFFHINGQLKALYGQIRASQEKRRGIQQDLQETEQALLTNKGLTEQALEACGVAESEALCAARHHDFDVAEASYTSAEEKRLAAEKLLYSLIYSRLNREYVEAQQAEQAVGVALAELDQDKETQEIQQKLDENSCFLRYVFAREEDACRALEKELQEKQAALNKAAAEEADQVKALQVQSNQLTAAIGQSEGTIRTLVEEQEKIEKDLFPDSLNRDVSTQRSLWRREANQTEMDIKGYEDNLTFYKTELQHIREQLPSARKRLQALTKDISSMELQTARIDSQADTLRKRLQQIPECANMADNTLQLYQRADFMTNQLGDNFIAEEEKGKALAFASRQAHRFVDFYQSAPSFSADPVVDDLLQGWSGDFSYLQSGADAFRAACRDGRTAEELQQLYPFWASTVITTADAVDTLLRRLAGKADVLSEPVFVLTDGEYRSLLQDGTTPAMGRSVTPAYWSHLLPDDFSQWLSTLTEEAEKRDLDLKRHEVTLSDLRQLRQDLLRFFTNIPFSEYQETTRSLHAAKEEAVIVQQQIAESEGNAEQCRQNIEKYNQNLYDSRESLAELQRRLQRLSDYEDLQRRHREILSKQEELRRQKRDVRQALEQHQQSKDVLDEKIKDLIKEIGSITSRFKAIAEKLYYQEVKDAAPRETNLAYAILADQRRQLKSRLDGIHANRGRLEEQLKQARRDQQRLLQDMADTKKTADGNLDESLPYPANGREKETQLRSEKSALLKESKKYLNNRDSKKQLFFEAQGGLKKDKERYFKRYAELVTFEQDLSLVRPSLEKKLSDISKDLTACQDKQAENRRHQEALEATMHILERENGTLQFTTDAIAAAIVPIDWQTDDSAIFAKAAPPLLTDSKAAYDKVQVQRRENEKKRDEFIKYCESHILEERRRRHIVDGIRSKDSYEEYVQWKNVITKTIQTSINLAETERKEHFAHIEHIVEHMALYIQEVGRGLKEIAAKTRIHIGTATKDIFTIHFTPKKDSEVRTAIRQYLSDLTNTLESGSFVDENGREDSRKVKEELAKRLRTQQIMDSVLGNHAIKVKCRKATSSDTFSDRPYDWEDSNKWSGGEMWSKNMALFLGCLNYLSEKRARIGHTKYHNRVVVADNPFGKASSDHVLDPVFFIAEQLGFQMIALTAHEDGNFIRKYFPVVYSCHFADISGGKGKVLLPEKEIKTAFFEEHHPEALKRLEDYEETGLFD